MIYFKKYKLNLIVKRLFFIKEKANQNLQDMNQNPKEKEEPAFILMNNQSLSPIIYPISTKEESPASTLLKNRMVLLKVPTIISKLMRMKLRLLLKKIQQDDLMKKLKLKQQNRKLWQIITELRATIIYLDQLLIQKMLKKKYTR